MRLVVSYGVLKAKFLFKSPLRFNTVELYLLIIEHCFQTPGIQKYSSDFNRLFKRWLEWILSLTHSCMEPVRQHPTAFSIKPKFLNLLQSPLWAGLCLPPQLHSWSGISLPSQTTAIHFWIVSPSGRPRSFTSRPSFMHYLGHSLSAAAPFCQTPDHPSIQLYLLSVCFRPHPWQG